MTLTSKFTTNAFNEKGIPTAYYVDIPLIYVQKYLQVERWIHDAIK